MITYFNIRRHINLFLVLAVVFLCIATYINILPNKLFFDDEELIYKNYYVQNLKYLPQYFTQNMIAGAGKISNMYRPILLTSFAADYAIWKDNPIGFHLTSIVLHSINAVLFFFLTLKLFGNKFIAFFSSLLFAVHPALSEAVIYASGRTDPLYAFFMLCSLLLFISCLEKKKKGWARYTVSILFFILSLLSKETAIVFPLILPLVILAFLHTKNIKELNDKKTRLVNLKFNNLNVLLKTGILSLPFFTISFIYFILRLTILNFADTLNFYLNNAGTTGASTASLYSQNLPVRLYTFSKVFFDYAGLIFFPNYLAIARTPQIITTIFNHWVILFIFAVTIFVIVAKRNWPKNGIIAFALLWFFILILPVSGIIPINNIESEHYLYLPSLSFFVIISYFVYFIWQRVRSSEIKTAFAMLLIIITLLLSLRTVARTFDWRDPVTFYNIALSQSPGNLPIQNNLAMAYEEKGDISLAIEQYKNIIAVGDFYPNIHHNLANAYVKQGEYKKAETEYKKALSMDPKFYFSYYGLLDLYQKTGNASKAAEMKSVIYRLQKVQQ